MNVRLNATGGAGSISEYASKEKNIIRPTFITKAKVADLNVTKDCDLGDLSWLHDMEEDRVFLLPVWLHYPAVLITADAGDRWLQYERWRAPYDERFVSVNGCALKRLPTQLCRQIGHNAPALQVLLVRVYLEVERLVYPDTEEGDLCHLLAIPRDPPNYHQLLAVVPTEARTGKVHLER